MPVELAMSIFLTVLLFASLFDGSVSFSWDHSPSSLRRLTSTALSNSASPLGEWSAKTGNTALRQVQFLASKVAESTAAAEDKGTKFVGKNGPKSVRGIGGVVYNNPEFNRGVLSGDEASSSGNSILSPSLEISTSAKREEQVWTALANLELDSKSRKSCE